MPCVLLHVALEEIQLVKRCIIELIDFSDTRRKIITDARPECCARRLCKNYEYRETRLGEKIASALRQSQGVYKKVDDH